MADRKFLWILGILILYGGCGDEVGAPLRDALNPGHDLIHLLPRAEVHREPRGFDFGGDSSRGALASGWSWNERSETTGDTFVWSDGEASTLDVFLVEPRDLRIEFIAQPYPFPDGPAQAVTPRVEDRALREIELPRGFQRHAFDLPAEMLRPGRNRLTFTYRRVASPRELGRGRDDRNLAVTWDRLEIRPAVYVQSEEHVPRIGPDSSLSVPLGSGVSWYLELPGEAWLTLEGSALEGGDPGHLDVHVEIDGEDGWAGPGTRVELGDTPRAIPLPGEGMRLVRLAVHAVAEDPTRPASGAVILERPEVRFREAWDRPGLKPRASTSARPPLVMIYLVDTLRADRVGVYGAERPLTPEIDAFASEATLFEQVVAQSPWTRPSSASVLTGLTPLGHGVQTLEDRLPEEAVSLPEIMQNAGYRTAAFSTNGHVTPRTGFGQGFEDFYFFTWNPPSAEVTEGVTEWLDEIDAQGEERPLFLYVHTLDPHAPYDPPDDLRERFAPGVDDPQAGTLEFMQRAYGARGVERRKLVAMLPPLYDAEVAANDRSFGKLLDELRERGMYDDALIVFVSDHGEEFDEHGFLGHGNNLHGESLNVPLLIKWPGRARGRRVAHRAQHVDVVPTILAHLGLEPPEGSDLPGVDLARLADAAGESVPERSVVSHLDYEERRALSVVRGDWKLIEPRSAKAGRHPRLYQVTRDPREHHDLHEERPVRAGWLASLLRELDRTGESLEAAEAELDEETRKSLEALGYF